MYMLDSLDMMQYEATTTKVALVAKAEKNREKQRKTEKSREKQRKTEKNREKQRKTEKIL